MKPARSVRPRRTRVAARFVAVLPLLAACGACSGGPSAGRADAAEVTALPPLRPPPPTPLEVPELAPDPDETPVVCYVGELVDGACEVRPEHRRALLSPALQREVALSRCVDDEFGAFPDAWTWEPDDDESALLAIDLNGPSTIFGLLSDFEGTSILFRVRDSETRTSLSVVKTNTSNTNTSAEVFAYRLSEALGFDGLVPPCSPVGIEAEGLDKLLALLRGTGYRDERKEANRMRVVRGLEASRSSGTPYPGATKPWLGAFMFVMELGDRDRLASSAVMTHLRANGPVPTDADHRLMQHTRLYEPRGTHRGVIAMSQLARDVSNLLLMDALMGQVDRYAGANVHMISVDGTRRELAERRNNEPVFDMGRVRVLALDNGAALKSSGGTGFADLTGASVAGLRVERFDRGVVDRLRGLAGRTVGYRCSEVDPDEAAAIWQWLGLEDASDRGKAEANLTRVLRYIDELETRWGDRIWLP